VTETSTGKIFLLELICDGATYGSVVFGGGLISMVGGLSPQAPPPCSRPCCFADLRQHITLSILANFQNEDQQKTLNTDDERVSKFQLQRPLQKKFVTLCRDGFREYFRHAYGPTRAAPGIITVTPVAHMSEICPYT